MARFFTTERRKQLAQKILVEGRVTIARAAEEFGVSIETIRKDLIFLEQEGIISKTHGGAIPSGTALEIPAFQKNTENIELKRRIASKALEYIPQGGSVILDSGTTTLALAELLKLRQDLTVFTNNALAIPVLRETHSTVYFFGGQLRESSMALVGSWTCEQIRSIRADAAFLGTDGLQGFQGPTTTVYAEAEIKRAYVEDAKQVVLLADSSKFTRSSRFQYTDWSRIDCVLTDAAPDGPEAKTIAKYAEIVTV